MIELYIENPLFHRGRWFELPVRMEEVKEKLSLDDFDEYLITDYMAPFKITNYEDFDQMNEMAALLANEEHHPAIPYLGELVSYGFFSSLLEAAENIDDIGVYSDCHSFEDYAEQYIEELGYLQGVPELIAWHIDYEGIGTELSMDPNLYQADDGVILDVRH